MTNKENFIRGYVIVLMTLLLGAVGGGVFHLLGLPAAWLSGAMILVAAVQFAGLPVSMPDRLRDAVFVILGISMGTGVKPELIERVGDWPISMLVLAAVIVGIMSAGYFVLHVLMKWDRPTSFFGAIPGALSYVMALAESSDAKIANVAVSQSIRLFVLVAVLPILIAGSTDPGVSVQTNPSGIDIADAILTFALCTLASFCAVRLKVPGGWLTGAFFASAALNGAGVVNLSMPQWFVLPCYVALGCVIGVRFGSVSLSALRQLVLASLAAFAAAMSISLIGAIFTSTFLEIPFGQALLAYAPGGLEVMTLLAFMLDLDPAFVAAHQLARYVGMVLVLPFVTRIVIGPITHTR
ncbi:MAG: AbrB family transcriptional regulator [Stappiaceae bacterium]